MTVSKRWRAPPVKRVATRTSMSLSLELLRKTGWQCLIVEMNMRMAQADDAGQRIDDLVYKKDLFGFADIIALKPKRRLLVQTTSTSNVSARIKKIQSSVWFEWVKQSEFEVHVHGWDLAPPWGYTITDMSAKDADGKFIYATLWDSILRAGPRSKKKPRLQQALAL